jgi:hypothetical protein
MVWTVLYGQEGYGLCFVDRRDMDCALWTGGIWTVLYGQEGYGLYFVDRRDMDCDL